MRFPLYQQQTTLEVIAVSHCRLVLATLSLLKCFIYSMHTPGVCNCLQCVLHLFLKTDMVTLLRAE